MAASGEGSNGDLRPSSSGFISHAHQDRQQHVKHPPSIERIGNTMQSLPEVTLSSSSIEARFDTITISTPGIPPASYLSSSLPSNNPPCSSSVSSACYPAPIRQSPSLDQRPNTQTSPPLPPSSSSTSIASSFHTPSQVLLPQTSLPVPLSSTSSSSAAYSSNSSITTTSSSPPSEGAHFKAHQAEGEKGGGMLLVIDGSHVRQMARRQPNGPEVDYQRLVSFYEYYYNLPICEAYFVDTFLESAFEEASLRNAKIDLVQCRMKKANYRRVAPPHEMVAVQCQGGVDSRITGILLTRGVGLLHELPDRRLAYEVQRILLMTSDTDFEYALQELIDHGKTVTLVGFTTPGNHVLCNISSEYIDLTKYWDQVRREIQPDISSSSFLCGAGALPSAAIQGHHRDSAAGLDLNMTTTTISEGLHLSSSSSAPPSFNHLPSLSTTTNTSNNNNHRCFSLSSSSSKMIYGGGTLPCIGPSTSNGGRASSPMMLVELHLEADDLNRMARTAFVEAQRGDADPEIKTFFPSPWKEHLIPGSLTRFTAHLAREHQVTDQALVLRLWQHMLSFLPVWGNHNTLLSKDWLEVLVRAAEHGKRHMEDEILCTTFRKMDLVLLKRFPCLSSLFVYYARQSYAKPIMGQLSREELERIWTHVRSFCSPIQMRILRLQEYELYKVVEAGDKKKGGQPLMVLETFLIQRADSAFASALPDPPPALPPILSSFIPSTTINNETLTLPDTLALAGGQTEQQQQQHQQQQQQQQQQQAFGGGKSSSSYISASSAPSQTQGPLNTTSTVFVPSPPRGFRGRSDRIDSMFGPYSEIGAGTSTTPRSAIHALVELVLTGKRGDALRIELRTNPKYSHITGSVLLLGIFKAVATQCGRANTDQIAEALARVDWLAWDAFGTSLLALLQNNEKEQACALLVVQKMCSFLRFPRCTRSSTTTVKSDSTSSSERLGNNESNSSSNNRSGPFLVDRLFHLLYHHYFISKSVFHAWWVDNSALDDDRMTTISQTESFFASLYETEPEDEDEGSGLSSPSSQPSHLRLSDIGHDLPADRPETGTVDRSLFESVMGRAGSLSSTISYATQATFTKERSILSYNSTTSDGEEEVVELVVSPSSQAQPLSPWTIGVSPATTCTTSHNNLMSLGLSEEDCYVDREGEEDEEGEASCYLRRVASDGGVRRRSGQQQQQHVLSSRPLFLQSSTSTTALTRAGSSNSIGRPVMKTGAASENNLLHISATEQQQILLERQRLKQSQSVLKMMGDSDLLKRFLSM